MDHSSHPKEFFQRIARIRLADWQGRYVSLEDIIFEFSSEEFVTRRESNIRANDILSQWVDAALNVYVESKFDTHVLTEIFRLREENIALKKEIAILKEYAN